MMRAYTVDELDDLREVLRNKWIFGSYVAPEGVVTWGPTVTSPAGGGPNYVSDPYFRPSIGRAYTSEQRDRAVEDLVRTHMLAGHTAQDLLDSEKRSAALDELPKQREG